MPLIFEFSKTPHNDCSVFTINNDTDYVAQGTTRGAAGEILIVEHIDANGVETWIDINSSPYLSKIAYEVSNTRDGHYHAELLRFLEYNNGTAYNPEIRDINDVITTYASLIYYSTTGLFYKNIQASTGIKPDDSGGEDYWEAITDFTDAEVRANTTIEVGVTDPIHDCRSIKCVKNELYKLVKKNPSCLDEKTLLPYLKKAIYLAGAQSKGSDNKPEQAEVIIEVLNNICSQC